MKVVLLFRQAAGAEGSRMPERVRNFHASGGEKLTAGNYSVVPTFDQRKSSAIAQ